MIDARSVTGSPRLHRLVYALVFAVAFATFVTRLVNSGGLHEPPETGDGHDYDAIAYNVWQGRGFGYDWSDPDWRKPYEGIPRYRLLLSRHSDFYPTTYRPPAMPLVLSAVYAVSGRNFEAWRILNCAIMAGAITTAAVISAEVAGIPAAILTLLIALQSRDLSRFATLFMTEPLAALMLALVSWTWIASARDGWDVRRAIGSGAAFGGLLASRTIFILMTPVLLVLPGRDRSRRSRVAWQMKALCLAAALVVIGPWWIRNVRVLHAFMPLGTQGGVNLPMGFGPRALAHNGEWASNPGDGAPEIAALHLDAVTSEVMLARYRQHLALDWMRHHPGDVLRLMRLHVTQELQPRHDAVSRWLLPLAVVAGLILWRSPAAWVIGLVLASTILSVAMTYSAGGRFMLPLQPLLIALVSAAIVSVAGQALRLARAGPAGATPRASA
jgi:4-amino-4-deoxy-L-arabinose transferase-like glycosyltransferase